jgi:type II secretory pathway predicted ATPase ExeA
MGKIGVRPVIRTASRLFKGMGVPENPFSVNLDPRYLYVTPHLEETFGEITRALAGGNCFAVLTGEIGSGKTTLMHRLRRWVRDREMPVALLYYTHLDCNSLLDLILAEFGIPRRGDPHEEVAKRLEAWLAEHHRAGRVPVLLVDEAQALPGRALSEIAMLLNLETPRGKLLQVVLAGGPDLERKLQRPALRQLQQHITVRRRIELLTVEETRGYVETRLRIAGKDPQNAFLEEAWDALHRLAAGIPRVINLLCERALMVSEETVGREVVERIAQNLHLALDPADAGLWADVESKDLVRGPETADMPPAEPVLALVDTPPRVTVVRPMILRAAAEKQNRLLSVADAALARQLLGEFVQAAEAEKRAVGRACLMTRPKLLTLAAPVVSVTDTAQQESTNPLVRRFSDWFWYGPERRETRQSATSARRQWRVRAEAFKRWLKEPVRIGRISHPRDHRGTAPRPL